MLRRMELGSAVVHKAAVVDSSNLSASLHDAPTGSEVGIDLSECE